MHGVIIHFTDTSENLKLRRYTLVLEEGEHYHRGQ